MSEGGREGEMGGGGEDWREGEEKMEEGREGGREIQKGEEGAYILEFWQCVH